jgi:CRP-like cAMP-binding protein
MSNRFIDKLNGFANLTPQEVKVLAAATAAPVKYAAKRDLIREGDQPGPVFVVLEGWACRYKILPNGARQVLAYLMPGDACDLHVGLLDEMDHSIQTITPALVATIDRIEMDGIMDGYPGIAKAMYLCQLIDEGTMRAWITSMGRRASIERAAHLMCELYLRARNIGLTLEPRFALPLSQSMLADSLGMTPVHLNRVMRELRDSGAMTLQRGSLNIEDPARLIRIAGFDENYLHRRLRKTS